METPAARGVRIEWQDVPHEIRDEIQDRLGGHVVEARTQPQGFSPASPYQAEPS
jgi:hypothetical protein